MARRPVAIGLAAAAVLGAGVAFRHRVQWYDACAEVWASWPRAALTVHDVRTFTQAGPYIGTALVFVSLLVAGRRGARNVELGGPLMKLVLALLCVEFLKLAVYRDRPFNLVGPAQHDSFPSGHVAYVTLCAATALHLGTLRRMPRDWTQRLLALLGSTAALATALSRVYLGRHWLSDVTASLLIGLSFWGLAPVWAISMRRAAVVVAGILVLITAGPHVALPSPMTFDDPRHVELPLGAVGPAAAGHGKVMSASWTVRTAAVRYSLLRIRVTPHGGDDTSCLWLDLDVDHDRIVSRPLVPRRRTYALPLPTLAPGIHEVRLRADRHCGRPRLRPPSFRLARASIEGITGRVAAP